jgi:hypothetical protein
MESTLPDIDDLFLDLTRQGGAKPVKIGFPL